MKILFWTFETRNELKRKITKLENENRELEAYKRLLKKVDSNVIFCEHCTHSLRMLKQNWIPGVGYVNRQLYVCELSAECKDFKRTPAVPAILPETPPPISPISQRV